MSDEQLPTDEWAKKMVPTIPSSGTLEERISSPPEDAMAQVTTEESVLDKPQAIKKFPKKPAVSSSPLIIKVKESIKLGYKTCNEMENLAMELQKKEEELALKKKETTSSPTVDPSPTPIVEENVGPKVPPPPPSPKKRGLWKKVVAIVTGIVSVLVVFGTACLRGLVKAITFVYKLMLPRLKGLWIWIRLRLHRVRIWRKKRRRNSASNTKKVGLWKGRLAWSILICTCILIVWRSREYLSASNPVVDPNDVSSLANSSTLLNSLVSLLGWFLVGAGSIVLLLGIIALISGTGNLAKLPAQKGKLIWGGITVGVIAIGILLVVAIMKGWFASIPWGYWPYAVAGIGGLSVLWLFIKFGNAESVKNWGISLGVLLVVVCIGSWLWFSVPKWYNDYMASLQPGARPPTKWLGQKDSIEITVTAPNGRYSASVLGDKQWMEALPNGPVTVEVGGILPNGKAKQWTYDDDGPTGPSVPLSKVLPYPEAKVAYMRFISRGGGPVEVVVKKW